MKALAALLALAALAAPAAAWERDVHDGLTRWLALRAGFDASQAEAIAVADARVDGGLLDTQTLTPEYACLAPDATVAREVQGRHAPAPVAVPAPPAERAVVPGGPAARRALGDLAKTLKGKEGLLLGKLGEALHPLQDSWARAGVPAMPDLAGFGCDPALASARPQAAGAAHAADLTHRRVADTVAAARATWDALLAYPPVQGAARAPAAWDALLPAIEAFAKADTKARKRRWFADQGIADTGFLEAISLPDGGDGAPAARWAGFKLPPLPAAASTQHDAPPDVRTFFDALLARWLGAEPVAAVLADAGGVPGIGPRGPTAAPAREVVARMTLWKLADHGAAAALAHASGTLGAAQLRQVDKLAHAPGALLPPTAVPDAVLPVQAIGPRATPLLPYLVRVLPGEPARAVALLRLRHLPYDTLAWVAQQRGGRWTLVAVHATVDP